MGIKEKEGKKENEIGREIERSESGREREKIYFKYRFEDVLIPFSCEEEVEAKNTNLNRNHKAIFYLFLSPKRRFFSSFEAFLLRRRK